MLKVVARPSDFLAMAEKVKPINLLPHKGEGFLSQFLNWSLTIGRLLIILTETLALGTFLYRFSLDMKISDLHDQIKNQSAIVRQFKSVEDTARNLQMRLSLAKKYDLGGAKAPSAFSDIIEMGRGKVTFKNLQVGTDSIKILAQAGSSNALSSFVDRLKQYPGLQSVQIDSIDNKTSSAVIIMSVTAKLAKTK